MAKSLQDPLLKTGLTDARQVKKIAREKYAAAKHNAGESAADAAKRLAQETQAARAERDREINRQKQEALARKAVAAQVRQLVEANRVERQGGELAYRFADGTQVQKIYVTALVQRQLARGQLAIARLDGKYELIPGEVAGRIRERDPAGEFVNVLVLATTAGKNDAQPDADDPYAQFQIPDDLMW